MLKNKRILVAKPGLDGHDSGAKVIALALRDAGADVIYTGLRKTPDFIARIAIDEDVDAVGLSILSGSHVALLQQTRDSLREMGAEDMVIFVGGTIPPQDVEILKQGGAAAVFTSDMTIEDTIDEVASILK
ncbi:MAG: cobalamin B12-binding domain-containing protein [Candidatus Reddybacter sp.]